MSEQALKSEKTSVLARAVQASDLETGPRLSEGWLRAARIIWMVVAVAALGLLIAALPSYAAKFDGQLAHIIGTETPPGARFFAAASGVASLASALLSFGLSALLFRRKFNKPMAIFLSFFLLIYGLVMSGPLEFVFFYWLDAVDLAMAMQSLLLTAPTIALLMLFPNGRFVPGWTRWVVALSVPWGFSPLLLFPFTNESINRNPFLSAAIITLFLVFLLIGVYAQIYRYRKASTTSQRKQIRWGIYGFVLWIAYIFISSIPYLYLTGLPTDAPMPWWAPASELGWWLSLNILPVCLTIAITRHRLWDIDLVVNRTLVYGGLTTSVLILYALIVGGMGLLFRTDDSLLLPLLATGLAALLFHPLHRWLQSGINRMMYGERDEPFEVLARLGGQLESTLAPEMVFPTIVETVSQALKLPYVAVAIQRRGKWQTVNTYGRLVGDPVTFPLVYQGETVGSLLVARRSPEEAFSQTDDLILRNIARQAGAAVHAVQLMADLRQSRQQLVAAREEERRRLRRDLHDGLGASLAALKLQAGIFRRAIRTDPDKAEALADEFREDIQTTIDDIRRLVYELRPPMLDQLGLVAAVRSYAAQCSRPEGNGEVRLRIAVEAPEQMPLLPAAVEVAAYRIVQEALTNTVNHARARHCLIRLELAGDLRVEVVDDGIGLTAVNSRSEGLGLLSMRERAEELGGAFLMEPAPGGGARILASLPLPEI